MLKRPAADDPSGSVRIAAAEVPGRMGEDEAALPALAAGPQASDNG